WPVMGEGGREVVQPAATVAAKQGLATLLIEKSSYVGGTTAISGGMVWVPDNHLMRAAGTATPPGATLLPPSPKQRRASSWRAIFSCYTSDNGRADRRPRGGPAANGATL